MCFAVTSISHFHTQHKNTKPQTENNPTEARQPQVNVLSPQKTRPDTTSAVGRAGEYHRALSEYVSAINGQIAIVDTPEAPPLSVHVRILDQRCG